MVPILKIRYLISPSILIFLIPLFSCNSQNNTENIITITLEENSIKIILDTDMGSDCDDVGALAMVNEYANRGDVAMLGVIYSSGAIPYGAGIIDAINRYYGNEEVPIGANYNTIVGDTVDKMLAEKLAKDTAAYGHKIIKNTDAVEQTHLLRKILSEQDDHSIVYITIGHTKGLYDLLASEPDSISNLTGIELAKKKIEKWVALGALHAYNEEEYHARDWNFFFNGTASYTKYLVDSFPRPSYFVSGGGNVMTGKSLADTPNGNIVRTAYRDWLWNVEKKTLEDQRPSWDLITVYFAVEEPKEYFEVFDNGYLDVDIEKGAQWIESDTNIQHYYVRQKRGYEDELSDYLNKLIARPSNN